ncbi:hypothetical protein GGI24_002926, partial [Coemansia furcata]
MSDDYTPNLEQLRELFPLMDQDVVHSVLHTCAGQLDAAVNALLSMNDPEYKPEEQ